MLSVAILLGPWLGPVPATPPQVQLEWQAPPECPDRVAVLEAIDRALGEVSEGDRRAVRVSGELSAEEPEGYVLRLTLDDGRSGARELRDTSCEELSEAAALVIAMAIDPTVFERLQSGTPGEPERGDVVEPEGSAVAEVPAEPGEARVEEPEPEPRGEDEPVAASEPEPEPRGDDEPVASPEEEPEEPALAFVGRFDGGVGGGPLPGPDGVVSVGAGVLGRRWRAELTASYWPPRSTTSASNPAIGVRTQLWTVGAQGCGEPWIGPVSIPLCAGLHAGAMHAAGTGEQQRRRVASRWVAVVVEPGVVWWTRPRLGLAIRASGHVALARPQWRSDPSGTVFESAPVGGTLRAGLELRLP